MNAEPAFSRSSVQYVADGAPRCNIELKARVDSLDRVRRIAAQLATGRLADEHQIDTYFHCNFGRLKLRETGPADAQLIWYSRPDLSESRASRYFVVPVNAPELLKQALAAALGVRTIVDKHREIHLHENVRIHLDTVKDLGCFLELEAVLDAEHDAAHGRATLRQLRDRFGIDESDVLAGSYGDMLEAEQDSRP